MLNKLLLVFVGGGLGCVSRYLISRLTQYYYTGGFPFATLLSNLMSCLIVAVLVYSFSIKGDLNSKATFLLLITGYCGGLSTFSTFSFETFELFKQGYSTLALLNVVVSISIGMGAMYLLYRQN